MTICQAGYVLTLGSGGQTGIGALSAVGMNSYNPAAKQWQTGYSSFPNTKVPRAAAIFNFKKQI
jgi:hypothetical protein